MGLPKKKQEGRKGALSKRQVRRMQRLAARSRHRNRAAMLVCAARRTGKRSMSGSLLPRIGGSCNSCMCKPMLETPRLLLRPVRPSDAEAVFAFAGDRAAMRYTHCHASLRECRRRLAGFEWQRRRYGFAPWAAVGRDDGRLLGWGGVYLDPFDSGWGPELGYRFHPAAWGRGYATELAAACLGWADTVLRLPKVIAFAHPENPASSRVLVKAGFAAVRPVPEMERILYCRQLGRPAAA